MVHKFSFESVISLTIIVKSEPEISLQTLLSLVVFQSRTTALSWRKLGRSHWSQFFLLKLSFSVSTKRKLSILLNSPLSITVKQYSFNLATPPPPKENSLQSLLEMIRIHEKKSSCIKLLSKHHDVMCKELSPWAQP